MILLAVCTLLLGGCNIFWGSDEDVPEPEEGPIMPTEEEPMDMGESAENMARIGDFVWEDTNRDGLQDSDEPGLGDVQVRIFNEEISGPEMVYNFTPMSTTTTNKEGFYSFLVPAGTTYWVYFDQRSLPKGYKEFTDKHALKDGEGAPALDSDANYTGITDPIEVPTGAERMYDVADAGLLPLTSERNIPDDPSPPPGYDTCDKSTNEDVIKFLIVEANKADVDFEATVTNLLTTEGMPSDLLLKHDADNRIDMMSASLGGEKYEAVLQGGKLPGDELFYTPSMVAHSTFDKYLKIQKCGGQGAEECHVWEMTTDKNQDSTAYFRKSDCKFWGVDYMSKGALAKMRVKYVDVNINPADAGKMKVPGMPEMPIPKIPGVPKPQ